MALYALIGIMCAPDAPLIDLTGLIADPTCIPAVIPAALQAAVRIIARLACVVARLAIAIVEIVPRFALSAGSWPPTREAPEHAVITLNAHVAKSIVILGAVDS